MSELILQAKNLLLAPAELEERHLQQTLNNMLSTQIDFADLYFQSAYYETWSLEDGKVKGGSYNIERGVGVRAVSGEKTGFAYSDDINLAAISKAASAAKSIARNGNNATLPNLSIATVKNIYPDVNPLNSLDKRAKIQLLESIDRRARAMDPRIIQVNASLSGVYEVVLIANSQQLLTADIRPLVRISVSVIAEEHHRREHGNGGGGGRHDYQYFLENEKALQYAEHAVHEALTNLKADDAPAGTMTVVLSPGWPGVLLHEAVGHGLEGDFNRKGISAFAGKIGEQVASNKVTVVDNATLPGRRGSLTLDDEGTPGQCTTLIENGILRGYMQDHLNAKLMGMKSTGNCRRESYAFLPIPRMTNTYMLAGEHDPQEIIASVDRGLYAVNFGGGQVDITSGKFVFSTSEAYLIENGKVTHPVRGATLIGSGPEVMKRISMIGNDLDLDNGIGVCGKEGQSVPVGVGQPTVKIDSMTVGGTKVK